ncbi:Rv3235 family protein [Actinomycetospora sp. CA-101289]|uniref:Rv3235 family protein n=1 Tax=Actinomycetospora sp. CA-101289 TaxID=3239893 RepID=UPI003D99748B
MVVVPPAPSLAPARVRRVGDVPVPRVRPLADVLPRHPRPTPPPSADARTRQAQDELDRVAAALRPVAARLLTAVADVLAGRRPPAHLDGLLAPAALATLVRAAPRPGARRPDAASARGAAPGAGLRGLRVCAVDRRAVEVAAVVHGRDRVRALAARLERDGDGPADPGRWRLVALCPG